MGAAAGRDSNRHQRGYAYLFVGGSPGYAPAYSYTWRQAVQDGAGTNPYDPGPSPARMCQVPIVLGWYLVGARRAIENAHCTVGTITRRQTDYDPGVVIAQHPAPGRIFSAGTRVKLVVSLGPSG
jgi:hypothetical protein